MEEKILIKGLETNFKIIGEGKPYSQTPFETGRPAESGDGPLLILHGWGSNSERWQKVGELLAKNGIKVIIPDLPGFGKSQKPSRAWGLDDYCEFAGEFIKFLNLER